MSEKEETTAAPVVESVHCRLCDGGTMRRALIKPYNLNVGIVLIVAGLLCLATGVLAFLGLLAVLFGIYFVWAKKDVWLCDKCGAIVERI